MTTCHHCQTTENVKINGNNWDGEKYERVDLCSDCFYSVGFVSAPRRPRQPRQARALYGDFAQLAGLHHIATDGSGRNLR